MLLFQERCQELETQLEALRVDLAGERQKLGSQAGQLQRARDEASGAASALGCAEAAARENSGAADRYLFLNVRVWSYTFRGWGLSRAL